MSAACTDVIASDNVIKRKQRLYINYGHCVVLMLMEPDVTTGKRSNQTQTPTLPPPAPQRGHRSAESLSRVSCVKRRGLLFVGPILVKHLSCLVLRWRSSGFYYELLTSSHLQRKLPTADERSKLPALENLKVQICFKWLEFLYWLCVFKTA